MDEVGKVIWTDLTVPDTERVRDFYCALVGWTHEPEDQGGYEDYHMVALGGESVAGIIHPLGINADIPPQWLIYITVEDLDKSMATCREMGGEVVAGPKDLGPHGRMCVVEDPAGAVAALIQPPDSTG
jgi:predicted enzyme related to lactoylglutathione lyase